jgi:hypothetical protein
MIELCSGCGWESVRERVHWRDKDVDGRVILRCILRKLGGHEDWMELAQDRDRWWALGGYGEGLSGSINAGNFLTSLLVSFS